MTGTCLNCGAPLPKGSTYRRKYCTTACRKQWHRRTRNPRIDQHAKVPPSVGIPDDPTQLTVGEILQLKLEPTLRKAVLDLKTKLEEQAREIALLKGDESWKEERVLDECTAKEVARFLAQKHHPS